MNRNAIRELCLAAPGRKEVLQGNIAFAIGCVRAGIHGADGYPGTPSTEVIDRGLSQVQDLITVGWSVNEAVATAVGFGHTLAGRDVVVTLKIPGLFQAADVFSSAAFFTQPRGVLIYYLASDFVPSSTQHVIDPRPFLKSCFLPVFEPRTHQEMYAAPQIAVELGRRYNTPVVILASGNLCHSEGLVCLGEAGNRAPVEMPADMRAFNCLPSLARRNYDAVLAERMPQVGEMIEGSSLNQWIKAGGRRGAICCGANTAFVREVQRAYGLDLDILSLAFTHPLPKNVIRAFCEAISGEIFVFEDGYRFLQEELTAMGVKVTGKSEYQPLTEWNPALIAEQLGEAGCTRAIPARAVNRPPMICAGCPYRLFGELMQQLKRRGKIEVAFGDIGCNALLYFMEAMDTGLAMGASEGKRAGYVLARPDKAARCVSIIGDSTECHSGLDATRNSVFRNVPGVKVVLDNYWTAMTGGQPAPTSPVNLAGVPNRFDLVASLEATGTAVRVIDAYDRKALRIQMRDALKAAETGAFITLVVRGGCIKKTPNHKKGIRLTIDTEKCQRCHTCLICPGNEAGLEGFPVYNNLCSGCGEGTPACLQMCPFGAIGYLEEGTPQRAAAQVFPEPPVFTPVTPDREALPEKLSLAIRGVGGQGNLFFGRVLTQIAFLAGFGEQNIVKGETHGMAQMGGPVISTFACGPVFSPVLLPGQADCLIAMERSEILRPGFVELLKPEGVILMAETTIVPPTIEPSAYPRLEQIQQSLEGRQVVAVDVLGTALAIGDSSGRVANVVMLGVLSKTAPFDMLPEALWLQSLKALSPSTALWAANYRAFIEGRALI
jgi:indolepyruvate ferredoxin oxidoreductase, alpha subunit